MNGNDISTMINKKQYRILSTQSSSLSYKANSPTNRFDHNYTDIAARFQLQSIKSIHHFHDCLLMFNTLNNYFSCHSIFSLFQPRQITYSLRSHRILHEDISNSNFGFYSTVNRLRRSWNLLPSRITNISSWSLFKLALHSLTLQY